MCTPSFLHAFIRHCLTVNVARPLKVFARAFQAIENILVYIKLIFIIRSIIEYYKIVKEALWVGHFQL